MAGSFHSHIDLSGGISRWVAGITSTHKVVFLAHLNDVTLRPNGRSTTYKLYALTRYVPFGQSPMREYEVRRRSTRVKSARLGSGQDERTQLHNVESVQLPLLLENIEVQMAIGRLFHRVDNETLTTMATAGWGSVFEAAFLCASETVEPGGVSGRVELEAKIYHLESLDLRMHSIFRIEG